MNERRNEETDKDFENFRKIRDLYGTTIRLIKYKHFEAFFVFPSRENLEQHNEQCGKAIFHREWEDIERV